MPAEQALTQARRRVGPSYESGGGASDSWRARLEESSALLAPLALIVGLALAGGGFDLGPRHVAGLAIWLVLAGMLALGATGRATLARPFYWATGLILGLALLSAISSFWSGSIELSVTEADRVLVYLGVFLAAFLIAQTDLRRQRFAEGIAIALALIAFLGLASRLLPHVFVVSESLGSGPRLRYPLGYWNANGVCFGIGVAMALWMSRRTLTAGLRWLAVASLPALLLALYFTYSRGGLLALLVAAGCLLALSHDRLWLLATLAIGSVGAVPAVLAVQARRSIADNVDNQAAVDQGVTVLLALAAGIALALLLFAGLRLLERRGGGLTGRAVALSRNRTVLTGLALTAVLLAIGAAIAVGGRAWSQFSSSDIQFPSDPAQHFGQLSGAGRHDFWRVAGDAFEEKPALGQGAGAYQFSWVRLRSIPVTVHDAHSLYIEAFAELGVVGGLAMLGLVGTVLWAGFAAWRGSRGRERELCAVLLAAAVAFAVGAAIDWFWEIAAMGAIFFLAGGALVAARCAPAGRGRSRRRPECPTAPFRPRDRRFGGRLDRRPRVDRPAARRSRDQSQPDGGRGRQSRQRDRTRGHGPDDRALGGLPLRAAGPAGRGPGGLPDRRRTAQPGDQPRGSQLAALLPALANRAPGGRRRRRPSRSAQGTTAESARELLARRLERVRMSRLSNTLTAASRVPPAPSQPPEPKSPPASAAARLGLTGPSGSRRRGALLRRLLAGGDWLVLVAALCLLTATTYGVEIGTLFWALLFSPAWILVVKLHGLYDNDHRRIRHSTLDELPSLVSASVLGALVLDGLLALSPVGPLSQASVIALALGTLGGCFVLRGALRFLWHRLSGVAAGIAVGPAATVDMVARRIFTHPETRLTLVGYLSSGTDETASELPRLGSITEIAKVASEYEIERVVVAGQELSEPATERLIEESKAAGLSLTFLPQHYGLLGPGIELNRIAELPVLDFRFSDPSRSTMGMKRALDIFVSALSLLLLSPLLVATAVAIRIDSRGPVFFRQRRAGKDGDPFTMVKFRTMVDDAEARLGELVDLDKLDEPAFKIRDDPRVTRVGRVLRRTSIDELPQLINVLRGQMSLVGPRPEEEGVVALYDERQRARLAIKPGLTGPMQVYGRGDLTFEERLAMERDYLDNLSLRSDLAILLRTPVAIIRGDGAY